MTPTPARDSLIGLMRTIASRDPDAVRGLLEDDPSLALAVLAEGATRTGPEGFFLDAISHHVYRGDTALHVAGASASDRDARGRSAAAIAPPGLLP